MEDFPTEDLHDIISIQIHLHQYGNDFKWMWVTHSAFLQNVLHCWTKKNSASVIYDTLKSFLVFWEAFLRRVFGKTFLTVIGNSHEVTDNTDDIKTQ